MTNWHCEEVLDALVLATYKTDPGFMTALSTLKDVDAGNARGGRHLIGGPVSHPQTMLAAHGAAAAVTVMVERYGYHLRLAAGAANRRTVERDLLRCARRQLKQGCLVRLPFSVATGNTLVDEVQGL